MLSCLVIVSFLITAASALACGKVPLDDALKSRVVGGHAPAEGNWPFVVQVLKLLVPATENSSALIADCTGSIVGRRHVLTAAHCADRGNGNINASYVKVRVGSVWTKDQTTIYVSKIFTGPKWASHNQDDIAIFELKDAIEFNDYAQPICLPKSFRERPGDPGYFVGWGIQNVVPEPRNETDYEEDIAVANENIVTFRKWRHCRISLEEVPIPHQEDFICAGQYMRLAHVGDSGGPLMANRKGSWFQVGTDSAGWKHDGTGYGKFARVTSYCKWFTDVTEGKVNCVNP